MANPYAKYSDPSPEDVVNAGGNPYSKYEEPGAKKRNYSWSEVPGAMMQNLKKGPVEVLQKAHRAVMDPANAIYKASTGALDLRDAILGMDRKKAAAVVAAIRDEYVDRYGSGEGIRRALAEHPYLVGSDLISVLTLPIGGGATVGAKAAQGVGTVASKVAPAASAVAKTVAKSKPGWVAGKLLKTGAAPTHVANEAAGFVTNKMIPAVAQKAVDVSNPVNTFVRRKLGDKAPAIRQSMQNAREIIPGSKPTASQAAVDARSRVFSGLGAAAEKRAADAFGDVTDAANAARFGVIDKIGGGPLDNYDIFGGNAVSDVLHGLSLRDEQAARGYAAANRVMSRDDDELIDLLNRDYSNIALNNARMVASQEQIPFRFGESTKAHTVPDPYGQNLPPTQVPANYVEHNGRSLQLLKEAFDKLAYDKPTQLIHGIDASKAGAIIDTRNKLVDWIGRNNQPWNEARQRYALQSSVLDRMKLRDTLKGILSKKLTEEYTPALRAEEFARAIADDTVSMNSAVTKSTGRKLHQRLDQMVPPREHAEIMKVKDDLARAGIDDALAREGALGASDIDSILTDALGLKHGGWMSRTLAESRDAKHAKTVTNAMMTPQGGMGLIDNAMAQEAALTPFRRGYDWMTRTGEPVNVLDPRTYVNPLSNPNAYNPVRLGFRYPALLNMYTAPQQEQQPSNAFAR